MYRRILVIDLPPTARALLEQATRHHQAEIVAVEIDPGARYCEPKKLVADHDATGPDPGKVERPAPIDRATHPAIVEAIIASEAIRSTDTPRTP